MSHTTSGHFSDQAWSSFQSTHHEIQRVEDTLEVAYACMEAVSVGFIQGTYTSQETTALGRALLDWENYLQHELHTLRTAHQANYLAWLNSSTA